MARARTGLGVTRLALVLVALVFVAVLFASAGGAQPQPDKVKPTPGWIETLAMDGPRVAYLSDSRVHVWNVVTGATSVVKGNYPTKGAVPDGPGSIVDELAIADKRVALITHFGNGQGTTDRLYTGPLGGTAHELGAYSNVTQNNGLSFGDWAAGVVGSGQMLAVSTWKSKATVPTQAQLSLITPSGLRSIASGPGAIVAEAAQRGRIAVLRSTLAWPAFNVGPPTTTPSVGIYSTRGKLLSQVLPASANELALSGNELLVRTETNTLEVYDWTTSTLLHTWTIPPPVQQAANLAVGDLAVSGQLAVYSTEQSPELHLLNLTTGKDVVIPTFTLPAYKSHYAAIDPYGLVYVVNPPNNGQPPFGGKLIFVPIATLLAVG
jgi:hypothetical protein